MWTTRQVAAFLWFGIVCMLGASSAAQEANVRSPAAAPAYESNQADRQEPSLAETKARLEALEAQVDIIVKHLGLTAGPSLPGQDAGSAEPVVTTGRLDTLELKLREIKQQLSRMQEQLGPKQAGTMKPVPTNPVPVPNQGKFIIRNWTGVSQYLSVNGYRFFATLGATDMSLPLQPVEAYLPYTEMPKVLGTSMWRLNGRDYEIVLNIRN
jgi:hypothetical protein